MTENPVPYASSCPRTEAEAPWNRLFEAADCHNLLDGGISWYAAILRFRRQTARFHPFGMVAQSVAQALDQPCLDTHRRGAVFWHPAQNEDGILPVERVAWTSPPETVLHGRAHNGNRPEGAAADALML